MNYISKFLVISLVIAVYVLLFTGAMYLYFQVFGENIFLLVLLLIVSGFVWQFTVDRFPTESSIHIWKEGFERTKFPMAFVCLIGAVGMTYVSSDSYSKLTVASFFLTIAALLLMTVIYGFKKVFAFYGFNIVDSKKSKREVI